MSILDNLLLSSPCLQRQLFRLIFLLYLFFSTLSTSALTVPFLCLQCLFSLLLFFLYILFFHPQRLLFSGYISSLSFLFYSFCLYSACTFSFLSFLYSHRLLSLASSFPYLFFSVSSASSFWLCSFSIFFCRALSASTLHLFIFFPFFSLIVCSLVPHSVRISCFLYPQRLHSRYNLSLSSLISSSCTFSFLPFLYSGRLLLPILFFPPLFCLPAASTLTAPSSSSFSSHTVSSLCLPSGRVAIPLPSLIPAVPPP